MKTSISAVLILAAAAVASPIIVSLDHPVTRGEATYSAVRVVAVDPSVEGLLVRTSLGPVKLCYPDADTASQGCKRVLTNAQVSQTASTFIRSTIPAIVKAWAQE